MVNDAQRSAILALSQAGVKTSVIAAQLFLNYHTVYGIIRRSKLHPSLDEIEIDTTAAVLALDRAGIKCIDIAGQLKLNYHTVYGIIRRSGTGCNPPSSVKSDAPLSSP
ncbi:hypothetical protein BCV70DRAFT_197197 [Testicularia cyperi]|uniref:Uncharacterized protein n=1 Tax=Testicularia cyperi TaxID=1882483 RepID=A0A317XYU7_9BASI|nr:hypothetical protein BCV70DRAFT_197197 [Testicularia cyperi]